MGWTVTIANKAAKQARDLPQSVRDAASVLVDDIRDEGPRQPSWPNYGPITGKKGCHHCHLQKGRPTYVAVWKVIGENHVEVLYVGTHEGAVYRRIC